MDSDRLRPLSRADFLVRRDHCRGLEHSSYPRAVRSRTSCSTYSVNSTAPESSSMMLVGMNRLIWLLRGVIAMILLGYVSTCSYRSHKLESGYRYINLGDAESRIHLALGRPSVREIAGGARFTRYGGRPCVHPCHTRLWYQNSMSLTGEAWSFDLDQDGRVGEAAD